MKKTIIVVVMILLIGILGTRHNIFGCGFSADSFPLFIRGLYFRGMAPPKVDVDKTAIFKAASKEIRNNIASLECVLEYDDSESIKKELDILYSDLYRMAEDTGYFYYYD